MADIILRNLSVDIPVFDVGRASLRKALLGRAIGGRFAESRSHVVVNALKNVDLDMHDGDRVALVGDNGSGKSSLLRVISHVYPPSGGTATIIGKVSPMFETTLGMSMDATGLENIQIAGTIWGMTRSSDQKQHRRHRRLHRTWRLPQVSGPNLFERHDAAAGIRNRHSQRSRNFGD